jgi:hypothetical protein
MLEYQRRRATGRALRWILAGGLYAVGLLVASGLDVPRTSAAAHDPPPVAVNAAGSSADESPLLTLAIAAAGVATLGGWRLVPAMRSRPVRSRPSTTPSVGRGATVLR